MKMTPSFGINNDNVVFYFQVDLRVNDNVQASNEKGFLWLGKGIKKKKVRLNLKSTKKVR